MNEHDTQATWQRLPVDGLKPAAARLLLALQTAQPNESLINAMRRSGIVETERFDKAYEELVQHGFIVIHEGREYVTLYAQEQPAKLTDERYSYPGTTIITKAVQ